MKQAQDLYRDEFAKTKTPKAREALATELLAKAKQQAAGDAAEAFVLLRLTRDLAVQAGDGATAISAIDAMTEKFELDGLAMKTDVLADLAKKAHMPVDHLAIAQQAADLMDDAFAAGNYPQAAHLGKLATAEGQRAHDRDVVLQARNRLKEVQSAIKLGEDFDAARAKLADQPDDADTNTIAASYYCFLKNDWEKGLPYLAKGRDAMLRALAQRELQDKPKDPADRVKLADAWWDLAQKADSRRKEKMLLHAGAWYAKAQPRCPQAWSSSRSKSGWMRSRNSIANRAVVDYRRRCEWRQRWKRVLQSTVDGRVAGGLARRVFCRCHTAGKPARYTTMKPVYSSGFMATLSAMLPISAKMLGSIEVEKNRTDPSAIPKFAPPEWSLPGEPQNMLFDNRPSFGEATFVHFLPSKCIIAPVVNSVAGPPMAQPSLLPGLIVVMRCNSPVMMVYAAPSEISSGLVLTFTRPRMPQRFSSVSSVLSSSGAGKKFGS